MANETDVDYRLSDDDENVHHVWDNSIEPALTVGPGDVVRFECRDALNGQLDVNSTSEEIPKLNRDPVHPLTGPVAVEGAEPGDVLKVDLLDFEHKGIGFTMFYPGEMGAGLLPEEFENPGLHVWDLDGEVGHFVDGIEIPLAPFPGNLGVAPAEEGEHSTIPPRSVGGNMDIKHLTAGSTLYLPVEVEDALFSVGDCHGAQGDGEVCVNGIEAPMFVTARFDVLTDMELSQPQFETDYPFTPTGQDERMYATSGISDDLMDATTKAISAMIDHLNAERGLSPTDAYILCSVAVDLKINEVVNAPNWTVSAYLPQSIFPE